MRETASDQEIQKIRLGLLSNRGQHGSCPNETPYYELTVIGSILMH